MAHTEERPPSASAGSLESADIESNTSGGDSPVAHPDGGKTAAATGRSGNGGTSAAATDEEYFDKLAQAVLRLLGARGGGLARRMADWPQLLNRADDICSLAAQGFVQAQRAGRIEPDARTGEHSAQSVAAYAFGIVNRLFAHELKRLRPRPEPLDNLPELGAPPPDNPLAALAGGGPEDSDGRLWGVLRSSKGACRPEDIIVAYLLASGMSSAEVRELLNVSENTPGNALKRVGRELRRQLELGSATVPGCDAFPGRDASASGLDASVDAHATKTRGGPPQ